jgi:hypothetical protein
MRERRRGRTYKRPLYAAQCKYKKAHRERRFGYLAVTAPTNEHAADGDVASASRSAFDTCLRWQECE